MKETAELLRATADLHRHLCPRQVLGVRMGQYAGQILGLDLPQTAKRLFTIVETDGCAADGIAVATNCWVGRRTLRVMDFGKVAATFVDTRTGRTIRIVPRWTVRAAAQAYAPDARGEWEAQLIGYQLMPCDELFELQIVALTKPVAQLISRPGRRATCTQCGEEVMNQREVIRDGRILCRSCAGERYYAGAEDAPEADPLPVRRSPVAQSAPY